MPNLLSSRDVIHVLEKHGFIFISQRGSHVKYRRKGYETLTVIVPANKKEIPLGTFRSILRQSQLSKNDFGQQ